MPHLLYKTSIALDWVERHPYSTISFVGLLICFPLILFGFPLASHDAAHHAIRFDNFSHQLFLGEIYPRWLYRSNGGLGAATFFYYQPFSYYLASLFKPLPISPFQQMAMASSLGVVGSGLTAYLWMREISSSRPALIGALIFLLMPYPIAHDLYVRAAFGEAFAFVWIPLIMFFVVRICRGGQFAIFGLAFSYGLLCLTHLPMAMVFGSIPVLYVLCVAGPENRWQAFAATVGGMVLGAGLAAMYIIPAVSYQDYAFIEELRLGHFSYEFWLMTTELAVRGNWVYFWMPLSVSLAAVGSFVAGIFLLSANFRRELLFWLVVLFCAAFMMLQISSPIWKASTYIQAIQFPFRLNLILSIATLPLIVLAITAIRRPFKWHSWLVVAFLASLTIYWANDFRVVATEAFKPPSDWSLGIYAKNDGLRLESHPFWPKTVPFSDSQLQASLEKIPLVDGERARAFAPDGNGQVNVLSWCPRKIALQTDVSTETPVVVSQFYYPGWQARVAGSSEYLPLGPTPDLGLIRISVPPGTRYIEVTLEEMWPEILGEWLSALCFLLTVGWFGRAVYLAKRQPPAAD